MGRGWDMKRTVIWDNERTTPRWDVLSASDGDNATRGAGMYILIGLTRFASRRTWE